MRSLLERWLALVTDDTLARSIAGDLNEGRARKGRLWWALTAAGLVVQLTVARLRTLAQSVPAALRASGLGAEIRQSARALIRTPVITSVVVLTLGLGFGLNTAIFSVVHGILFDPLPFDRADELVIVTGKGSTGAPTVFASSYPDYRDWRASQTSFRDLAISTYWTFTVTGTDVPLRLLGQRVTGSFFPLLGMRPAAGRWIDEQDDVSGGREVVVLSHGLWQRLYAGDQAAIGRTLQINGLHATVIGVMPPAFRFPFDDVELWVPVRNEFDTMPRNSRFLTTVARLRPGVRRIDAEADLVRLAAGLEALYPASNRDWRPSLHAAVPALTVEARPRLLLLFGAVLVVLVVACVNVATLLLSRAASRRREFDVRASLGASRARILRVTLLESAWLGVAGLAAGVAMALPAVDALRTVAPDDLPRFSNVGLQWPVFLWAAAAMVVFVVAGALAPMRRSRRGLESLRSATIGGAAPPWGRRALIVCQVAGTFALLAGTGLLVRSFGKVLGVDPGFDPSNVATMRVFLTPPAYRSTEQQIQYVERAVEALRAMPGVVGASAVSQPPFDTEGAGTTLPIAVEGRTYAPGGHPIVSYRAADAAYFSTLGLRFADGRSFAADDRRGAPLVAVVNEAMARQMWPGERAVGRRFEFADGRNAGAVTVVGVVNDVATLGLERAERPTVYAPYVQRTLPFLRWMTLVVRTSDDVETRLPLVRAQLQAVDANQPLYAVSSMDRAIARSLGERRFSLALMLAFAVLTLTLSALGLYGTLAQRVADRSRELGVRLALGATSPQVFRLVMTEGVTLVAAGVALGTGLVAAGVPLIRGSLFGVPATDVITYVGILGVLAVTTLLATFLPSRAAARTDPLQILKGD